MAPTSHKRKERQMYRYFMCWLTVTEDLFSSSFSHLEDCPEQIDKQTDKLFSVQSQYTVQNQTHILTNTLTFNTFFLN